MVHNQSVQSLRVDQSPDLDKSEAGGSRRTSCQTFERVSGRSGRLNSVVDGEPRSVLHIAAQRGKNCTSGVCPWAPVFRYQDKR